MVSNKQDNRKKRFSEQKNKVFFIFIVLIFIGVSVWYVLARTNFNLAVYELYYGDKKEKNELVKIDSKSYKAFITYVNGVIEKNQQLIEGYRNFAPTINKKELEAKIKKVVKEKKTDELIFSCKEGKYLYDENQTLDSNGFRTKADFDGVGISNVEILKMGKDGLSIDVFSTGLDNFKLFPVITLTINNKKDNLRKEFLFMQDKHNTWILYKD